MAMASSRFAASARAAGSHLTISGIVALCFALLVFKVWYPHPFDKISGGRELVLILLIVDAICGPLLTLIVFNPGKRRRQLVVDLSLIALLQLSALVYGVKSTLQARPIWLAFEGDRYRVVRVVDVDISNLKNAQPELQRFSLAGPKAVGVRLLHGGDPDFLKSIELSVQGVHPSFRPERWVAYSTQSVQVIKAAKPVVELYESKSEYRSALSGAIKDAGVAMEGLGYLPLATNSPLNWIVLIDLKSAEPKAYAEVDGW